MRCAWPRPCDEYPEPRREGSMLQYCTDHEAEVDAIRAAMFAPADKKITDPKFLKFLAKEKKARKNA